MRGATIKKNEEVCDNSL